MVNLSFWAFSMFEPLGKAAEKFSQRTTTIAIVFCLEGCFFFVCLFLIGFFFKKKQQHRIAVSIFAAGNGKIQIVPPGVEPKPGFLWLSSLMVMRC